MKRLLLILLLAVLFALPAAGAIGATHALGWEDMFAMVRLSDPQPSPDGIWVLFSRTAYDVDSNKGNTDLGLVSLDGKIEKRLTSTAATDTNGRWLPDGKTIVFLSDRSGSTQIWSLSLGGGEAERVSDLPLDIDGFELSPDGHKVLFWAGVFPDCKTLACSAERLEQRKKSPIKARIFDRLFIRHWDTWNDGRRNHLFVMDLKAGKPRDLMAGMDQDSPTKPWGGSDELAWSPDSASVAFSSKPSAGEAWHTNSEIYLARADGRGKPRCLTADNPAWDTGPAFSPDGKRLGYLAMDRPGCESDRFHIVIMDLKNRKKQPLTAKWDRSAREVIWSADGRTIYTTAEEDGRVRLFAVDTGSGQVRTLVKDGCNNYLKLISRGKLVFLRDRMVHPREVMSYDPVGDKTTRVSHVNDARMAQARVSEPEDVWFEHDGFRIHGWLLRPVDFKKGRLYPLAFLVHGGPQGSWEDDFHYRWNPEFYAGAGYVVVGIDFRGSTGYGQVFTDAIHGNWGPGPYSDLMAGLRHVLEKYKFIDRKRMCALGASFGGYMINWIAGQDHPFKCLVNHDGDFDTTSSYFNTEELWFPEWDMTGPPWKVPEVYARNSPVANVSKWKTPMLVIQGGLDFRVVETEGFSTFNALQRQGIPSKLLYFPDENHWVKKPQNSRLWHRTVLEWIDRYTHTRRPRFH
ncbi:MAG TPA: S9 family peptidase [Myxococcota bacterium]|nr:S9 family peptidase [Myxococcota bacterium]